MKNKHLLTVLSLLTCLAVISCKKDNNDGSNDSEDKYVIITLSDRVTGNKAGYISAFNTFPSGTVSNVGPGSLEGEGMGGWRVYGDMIFKMFSTASNSQGIEKIKVSRDGTVSVDKIISPQDVTEASKYNGNGNLVIENATSGYYWDASEPYKIQQFNPTTMINTGSMDFEEKVKERVTPDVAFAAIGQKFLAIKGGKLFANLTYAKVKPQASQVGFFDDLYTDVYIAVIDLVSGDWESVTSIENTGSIAYINENHMYDFDDNGDLYIVTQGTDMRGLGGKSKIARIKANETSVDKTWELNFSDFRAEDNGKFVNVFAKNGRLIVTLNTITLTGGENGNINSQDIWEFYSIDVNSPSVFNKIEGIPVGTNPGAAMLASEVDGNVYLRGATLTAGNGYYEYDYNTNSASLAFSIDIGGAVSGFHKLKAQ